MQTAVETLPEDRVRVTVEVPAEDVAHAVEHALEHLQKDLRVPGFRKGKVPPGVVRARLGEQAVVEEAVREQLPRWYGRALDTARIEAVDQPEIDYERLPVDGEAFRFTATVPVAPVAQLPEDLRLEAVRPAPAPPEGAVDQELERLRRTAGELAPLDDRPAARGDFALIDFAGRIGPKPIKDGSASDYLVQLGSNRLVGGIEDAVVGMSPGETKSVEIVFPSDYGPKAIAGRTATFEVTLKELKQRVVPELDDEFARNVSEFETLAELREDLQRRVDEQAAVRADGMFRTAVLEALGRAATVDVPPSMVSTRVRERIQQAERSLAQQGIGLESFLQQAGRTLPQLVAELSPEAESEARQELALKAYADREGVQVTDDELEDFVREETAGEKDPAGAAEKILGGPAAEAVRDDLRLRRALDRLVEVATPLTPEAAQARSALWTPGSDPNETSAARPEIWTPGSNA